MFKSLYNFIVKYFKLFKKDTRLLMLGLDSAGKTTLLYKLKCGIEVSTIPTIGFNVETIEYKNVNMTIWDIGGQHKIQHLWRHYIYNTNGLIFVIDSNDRDRINEVKDAVNSLRVHDELKNVPFLFFANKQDVEGCLTIEEIIEGIDLNSCNERKWYIQKICALNGEGVYEGLEWLSNQIK